jgi:hypothetical protein
MVLRYQPMESLLRRPEPRLPVRAAEALGLDGRVAVLVDPERALRFGSL